MPINLCETSAKTKYVVSLDLFSCVLVCLLLGVMFLDDIVGY